MNYPEVHIGGLIKQEVYGKGKKSPWMAKQLDTSLKNAMSIFKRKDVHPAMLRKIGLLLNRDFFEDYLSVETIARMKANEAALLAANQPKAAPTTTAEAEQALMLREIDFLRNENALLKEMVALLKSQK